MSHAWSWYVIVLIALNIGGCAWLLWWTGRRRPGDPAPDDTSHVWDGDITEYNKPLPRWWINLFYLTIVFAIGYLLWFPGLGNLPGYAGWTSAAEHDRAAEQNRLLLEETFAIYGDRSIPELAQDASALAVGRSVYVNTCAACHGSTARGAPGYPNLSDTIWNWGGTPEQILTSILDGREGVMPPWESVLTSMGGENAMAAIVAYTRSLSRPELADTALAAQGKPLYDGLCVACHGPTGDGNPMLGAPALNDDDWLYGGSDADIHRSIALGRHGSMPAHRALLGESRARLVAAYIWSLSNPADSGAP